MTHVSLDHGSNSLLPYSTFNECSEFDYDETTLAATVTQRPDQTGDFLFT
jgi:hypothetical protein